MIIIADSGSTKTHWVMMDHQKKVDTMTQGLNPYFASDNDLQACVEKIRVIIGEQGWTDCKKSVFFYGAGCGSTDGQQKIEEALSHKLTHTNIKVEGDMMAACRCTCGRVSGIVGILGTGSNACLFDGEKITQNIAALGYALGCDEGSGNAIGRTLLREYLRGRMPKELGEVFEKTYALTKDAVLENIYHQPYPNRYMASFATFAKSYEDHEWMDIMLRKEFDNFFEQQIDVLAKDNAEIHLVGSVAKGFENQIRGVAKQHHKEIGIIRKEPMEGLVTFHCEE